MSGRNGDGNGLRTSYAGSPLSDVQFYNPPTAPTLNDPNFWQKVNALWTGSTPTSFAGRVVQGVGSGVTGGLSALEGAMQGKPFNPLDVTNLALTTAAPDLMFGAGADLNALRSVGGGGIRAYHGSPYSFDRFELSHIGRGEGAQAYGHGLYFAENEDVARYYRDKLAPGGREYVKPDAEALAAYQNQWDTLVKKVWDARMPDGRPTDASKAIESEMDALHSKMVDETIQRNPSLLNPGSMYAVDLKIDPDHLLDWDTPLGKQSQYVQDMIERANLPKGPEGLPAGEWLTGITNPRWKGQSDWRSPEDASASLREAGIPGIRYLDQASRNRAPGGTSNYVVFDPSTIDIVKKYGLPAMITGGATTSLYGLGGDNQQQ
jgi:hypothetical protein